MTRQTQRLIRADADKLVSCPHREVGALFLHPSDGLHHRGQRADVPREALRQKIRGEARDVNSNCVDEREIPHAARREAGRTAHGSWMIGTGGATGRLATSAPGCLR